MALFDEKTRKFLCECGCGKEVSFFVEYASGHFPRTPEFKEKISMIMVGIIRSEGFCRSVSRGVKQAYIDDPTLRERAGGSNFGNCLRPQTEDEKEDKRQAMLEFYASERGQKLREERSGEGSPNWKGGHNYKYGYGWDAVRDIILARDRHICQGCGSSFDLVVHHIDGVSYNLDNRNLITVCHSCNSKAFSRYQSEYWEEYYTKKINQIYSEKVEV